jgi:hypothetical protein
MAPEQYQEDLLPPTAGPAIDLFAVGVLAHDASVMAGIQSAKSPPSTSISTK